jgi:hypothetical protein
MAERIDIERALDKLAGDEAGFKFQNLAVVLANFGGRNLLPVNVTTITDSMHTRLFLFRLIEGARA